MKPNYVSHQHIMSFLLPFLVLVLTSSFSDASKEGVLSIPGLDFLPVQLRADFFNKSSHEETVVLLQEDGNVDTIKTFFIQLPDGILPENTTIRQESSENKVLKVDGNSNILTTFSGNVLNVTSSLSFGERVGQTNYTLTLLSSVTDEVIATVQVPFTIVGITFYTENSEGRTTIVSGDGNRYSISYEEMLQRVVSESRKIRVFIQYPDGSSSLDYTEGPLPNTKTLQTSVTGLKGQFNHDSALCDLSILGTTSASGEVVLPDGCAYGFYVDSSNQLCFYVAYEPYRAGDIRILFSWPGITSNIPQLAEETFELPLDYSVTGTPPVAILELKPSHDLLRPEGGEILICRFINADLYNISYYYIQLDTSGPKFSLIEGSITPNGAPAYDHTASFQTVPGEGIDFNWKMSYTVASTDLTGDAVYVPSPPRLLSYDTRNLSIDSIEPAFATEAGGETIVIKGYFPFFDPSRDGLYFSGTKIGPEYFISVTDGVITFKSPPRTVLGNGFEHYVTVRMGGAISPHVVFSYIVGEAQVHISQSGTSALGEETYLVGDCTPVSFTALVVPFTKQIRSYAWFLYVTADTENNLLQGRNFSYVNSSSQTIEFLPNSFDDPTTATSYTLKIVVQTLGSILEKEIILLRDHIVSIGAFILKAPVRTVAYPDTPLRLSAVVRPPGECYSGNETMVFEWRAFDKVQIFSSANATGSPSLGQLTTTPARLGWEYVVPRESLTSGNHTIQFTVWMLHDESVRGEAMSYVLINESPIVAVIRHGEEYITVNHKSTLNMYGTNSYDPDVFTEDRFLGLSYEWQCQQSENNDFSADTSSPCIASLLPNNAASNFSVQLGAIEDVSDIKFLQYTLLVRKNMRRVSSFKKIVVEVQDSGSQNHLEEYSVKVTNADGLVVDWNNVAHYEQTVITVTAPPNTTWTYELMSPSIVDFFSSSNLITSPLFYSKEEGKFQVSGNVKPLGIEAGAMRPFTTYKFKILFNSDTYDDTSVIVSLRTAEVPTIGFPMPSIVNGTTSTIFTATAGIPSIQSSFSYFFIMYDSEGNEFCMGGCTGYDVIHFQIGRPGTYTLGAYVFDMQGKALLDSANLTQQITVVDSGDHQYTTQLNSMFAIGNDNSWTQLAHDLALLILKGQIESSERQALASTSTRQSEADNAQTAAVNEAAVQEELLEKRMEYAYNISDGAKKIYCRSFPNSYHGRSCITFAIDLSKQKTLSEATVYNIIQTVECCVKNTPVRTINKMGDPFGTLLNELNRLAFDLYEGGTSRRRLLDTSRKPANVLADIQMWTGQHLATCVTSGKLDGFTSQYVLQDEAESHWNGQVSMVVASNPAHVPDSFINGKRRNVVVGPSDNEVFYSYGNCLEKIFSENADKRLVLVLHTMNNFLEYGFQDPPTRSNLGERLYWTQIYEQNEDGVFGSIAKMKDDECFCWRLPVTEKLSFLEEAIDDMPGLFGVTDLKQFNVSVGQKGEKYRYVYTGSKTTGYNISQQWMQACRTDIGLVGTTIVSKSEDNALADGDEGQIVGTGTFVVLGVLFAALAFVVIALASVWLFAVRSMSDGAAPIVQTLPNELYVERDNYGRGNTHVSNATGANH